jgi:hypothetical protein
MCFIAAKTSELAKNFVASVPISSREAQPCKSYGEHRCFEIGMRSRNFHKLSTLIAGTRVERRNWQRDVGNGLADQAGVPALGLRANTIPQGVEIVPAGHAEEGPVQAAGEILRHA